MDIYAAERYELRDHGSTAPTHWDESVASSINGTIFHKASFLAYHGARFEAGQHFLTIHHKSAEIAQISLYLDANKRSGCTPYGASYGGFTYRTLPRYREVKNAIGLLLRFLTDKGTKQFEYGPPPVYASKYFLDTERFVLLEKGFRRELDEVCSVIRLDLSNRISDRAKRAAVKAERAGVEVRYDEEICELAELFDATFSKHHAQPTHSVQELTELARLCPGEIRTAVAKDISGQCVAAVVLFIENKKVCTAFYILQDEQGRKFQAMSMLILDLIETMRREGFEWLNLGTSTEKGAARESVFQFKENFGSEGMFRDRYSISMGA